MYKVLHHQQGADDYHDLGKLKLNDLYSKIFKLIHFNQTLILLKQNSGS